LRARGIETLQVKFLSRHPRYRDDDGDSKFPRRPERSFWAADQTLAITPGARLSK